MTPDEMEEAIIRNMPDRTGKALEEWLDIASRGPATKKERMAWLKEKYRLGHFTAQVIAKHSLAMRSR